MTPAIHLQRVYDAHPPVTDGTFLVDRLWPRGLRRERLTGVCWLKEVAPSARLRQAFHAAPENWVGFVADYTEELERDTHWQMIVDALVQRGHATLLYASKDTQHNHAQVLRDFLLQYLAHREPWRVTA